MLTESFKKKVQAQPEQTYSVMITVDPNAANSDLKILQKPSIEKYAGLEGIYKAQLTGHDILALQQDNSIQAIEPDDVTFHAL